MAKCDQGYPCDICGKDVEALSESDLYLRYVIGRVDPETLHTAPERHLRCNPSLAQFIVDPGFPPVIVDGPFGKQNLDSAFVAEQEQLITRGWRRLQEVPGLEIPIVEYPLPEVMRNGPIADDEFRE